MTLDIQQLFERFAALPQCIVLRDFDPGNEFFEKADTAQAVMNGLNGVTIAMIQRRRRFLDTSDGTSLLISHPPFTVSGVAGTLFSSLLTVEAAERLLMIWHLQARHVGLACSDVELPFPDDAR